jgi:hypothetical protein
MKIDDFAGREPKFVLEDYFAGTTRAYGIFEDRFGDVRREFVVDITGSWDGTELILDEHFNYVDGEKSRRVWRIRKTGVDTYEGRADDVVGVARGRIAGNTLNWAYDLDLKVGERVWRVHFDDWMFLQPDGVVINRARMSKFGIELGAVTIVFQHRPAAHSAVGADAAIPASAAAAMTPGGVDRLTVTPLRSARF